MYSGSASQSVSNTLGVKATGGNISVSTGVPSWLLAALGGLVLVGGLIWMVTRK